MTGWESKVSTFPKCPSLQGPTVRLQIRPHIRRSYVASLNLEMIGRGGGGIEGTSKTGKSSSDVKLIQRPFSVPETEEQFETNQALLKIGAPNGKSGPHLPGLSPMQSWTLLVRRYERVQMTSLVPSILHVLPPQP